VATRWQIDEPILDKTRTLRFTLVRHGESDWNAQGRVQGHLGGGLTVSGRVDAQATAAHLVKRIPRPDLVISSDLARVVETAQPYADQLGMAIRLDERIREIDNGDWSGLRISEVVAQHAKDIEKIRLGDDLPRGGGETVANLYKRTKEFVRELAVTAIEKSPPDGDFHVVAFAHGGSIRTLTALCLGIGPKGMRNFRGASNCAISELSFWIDGSGSVHSGVLSTYNSTGHLATPASGSGAD